MKAKQSKTSIRIRLIAAATANAEARRDYNFAVARIFTVVRDAKLDPWTHRMPVGANDEFTLTWKRDPRPEWNLALYDLIPADELDFKGTYVKDHVIAVDGDASSRGSRN